VTDQPKRARRCQLAVPGSSEKMLTKAAAMDIDHVFCDLEDAVAPTKKAEARSNIVAALNDLDWGRTTRCVRINDTTTQWCHDDIITIVEGARENIDTIMLTKAMDASDLQFVDKLLTQLEKKLGLKKRIGLEVLIEEVQGMQHAYAIAHSCPRMEALVFGMGDYAASQGIRISSIGGVSGYPGDIWHYARYQVAIAARAAGIDAVDGPFGDYQQEGPYRSECERAHLLGMSGKWAIHPAQVPIAQEVFSPSAEDIAFAREIIEVYKEGEARGVSSISHKGTLVDAASLRLFMNTINQAELFGL
jgi:citrate lyase subunit beta / citryl-CoA lyase